MFTSLNNRFEIFIEKLAKRPLFFWVSLLIILDLIISIVFSFWLFPNHNAGPKFDSKIEAFILVVIFSPVIETLPFSKNYYWFYCEKISLITIKCMFNIVNNIWTITLLFP